MSKRVLLLLAAALVLAALAGCGGDDPTAPPLEGGDLLLSRTSVAVVPGGSETVAIVVSGLGGAREACTAVSSDPGVATVVAADSTLTVTGVAVGACTVTVTSQGGLTRSLPVQVYDPTVIDTGELLITFTDEFSHITTWAAGPGCSIWRPVAPEGFHALGSHLDTYTANPNGQRGVMVVKAKPGTNAIAFTDTFELMLNYSSREFWRPVPPAGYVALGMVVTHWTSPDSVACIRADLTVPAAASPTPLYTFNAYSTDFSWWGVEQPNSGPHGGAYLAPGTFFYEPGLSPPTLDPVLHILNVELPLLAEAPPQEFAPTLAGYASPPQQTAPRFARAMLAPCTIVRDAQYADDMPWRIANSPFYRLERQVYYKLLYHNYNQTSEVQTNSVTLRSGASVTQSEAFHVNTGVSIAFETGVDIKMFSAKVTTTVSLEMGYETQTSVSQLEEKEVQTSINTAPGKAAAMWQEFNRYVLYRHDGTTLEPVSAWEFGIDSYVTDEYPD
ncbi:MAG: Vps62-related protein [Candidatus Krumholzibacteriia bacterium]